MRLLFIFWICTLLVLDLNAQQQSKTYERDSAEVTKTLDGFLDAFANLKWEKFTSYLADDARMFFPPSAKTPARANNKMEIERIFKNVFENARKGKTGPPYLIIQPKDMRVQTIGRVAIVTFHLFDPNSFGRRTIVMRKEDSGDWRIIHIHASAIVE